MATLVGRVGLVVKGAWDSSVAYAYMDVVTYNNSTYIAKQAVPAGTLPTNTTYWELSLDASLLQTKSEGANKVVSATAGNIAMLDANGDLTDGGAAVGSTSISGIGDGSITGALSTLESALNGTPVNVTASSSLNPKYMACRKFGKFAIFYSRFSTTANISADTELFTGLPSVYAPDVQAAYTALAAFIFDINNASTKMALLTKNGTLKTSASISNNTDCTICVSYIAN